MKKNVLLFFFLTTLTCFSQQKNISLEQVKSFNKIITGSIEDHGEITMHLESVKFSDVYLDTFSVKGWYYFNKTKMRVPVFGMYNSGENISLIHSKDKAFENIILSLDFISKPSKNFNNTKIEEKLTIFKLLDENTWVLDGKISKLKINNIDDLFKINNFALLKVDKTIINLSNYFLNPKNLKIISSKALSTETRILIKYNDFKNPVKEELCADAQDFGYLVLILNNKNEIIKSEEIIIENCKRKISHNEITTDKENLLKYQIIDSTGNKEVIKIITIDTESVSVLEQNNE